MSMQTSLEGDPGKMAYLRNPNWAPTPREHLREVKVMPGTCERCVFGTGEHADDCVTSLHLHAPINAYWVDR